MAAQLHARTESRDGFDGLWDPWPESWRVLRANGELVPLRVSRLRGFRQRLLGLVASSPPPPAAAVLLPGCAAVHTCFMRYAIDVCFVDAHMRIIALREGLPAWRFAALRGASAVFELRAGESARLQLAVGDRLLRWCSEQ